MKNVDDLIDNAVELSSQGLSKGEIADELNVSRETASWLVDRQDAARVEAPVGPDDIHIDWSTIGRSNVGLAVVGRVLADLLGNEATEIDVVVGIENAGVPIATMVANELGSDLGAYMPRKHHWEEGDIEELSGSFSRNFASIEGRRCYLIDDTITSGTTLAETVEAVRERGGTPVACGVIVDKRGIDEVDDVPVESLIQVIRVAQ